MNNKYITFNKLVLYTCEAYITKSIEDELTIAPIHKNLQIAIRGYMIMGRFSPLEAKRIISLNKDEKLKAITEKNISFLVYVLELIKLWVDDVPKKHRPHLNISDKKLRVGRSLFAMGMLKLKQSDEDKYQELRDIIDVSVDVAREFYEFNRLHLIEG